MKIVASAAVLPVILAVPALAQDSMPPCRGCTAWPRWEIRPPFKSAGGIDDTIKQTKPNVYATAFSLGGVKLDVVANASVTPATPSVVEAQRGCKWNAVAPW